MNAAMPRVCVQVLLVPIPVSIVDLPWWRTQHELLLFVFPPAGFRGATTNLRRREPTQGTRKPALRCLLVFMLPRMTASALSRVATRGAFFSRRCVALLPLGRPPPPIASVDTSARSLFFYFCAGTNYSVQTRVFGCNRRRLPRKQKLGQLRGEYRRV